jgi:hypothetical protein
MLNANIRLSGCIEGSVCMLPEKAPKGYLYQENVSLSRCFPGDCLPENRAQERKGYTITGVTCLPHWTKAEKIVIDETDQTPACTANNPEVTLQGCTPPEICVTNGCEVCWSAEYSFCFENNDYYQCMEKKESYDTIWCDVPPATTTTNAPIYATYEDYDFGPYSSYYERNLEEEQEDTSETVQADAESHAMNHTVNFYSLLIFTSIFFLGVGVF